MRVSPARGLSHTQTSFWDSSFWTSALLLGLLCPAARLWDSWTELSDCYVVGKPDRVFCEIHCRLFTQRTHNVFDPEGLSFGECLSCCLWRALLGLRLPIGQLEPIAADGPISHTWTLTHFVRFRMCCVQKEGWSLCCFLIETRKLDSGVGADRK